MVVVFRRVVVKIGTKTVFNHGSFNYGLVERILQETKSIETVIVTSGAVGWGRHLLGNNYCKKEMARVGQAQLNKAYGECARKYGRAIEVNLFTNLDELYSASDAINKSLLEGKMVVVNEDNAKCEQTEFGDNDILAAELSKRIDAMLIILSDVSGVYDCSQKTVKVLSATEAKALVDYSLATSNGGMDSKIRAAQIRGHALVGNKGLCNAMKNGSLIYEVDAQKKE